MKYSGHVTQHNSLEKDVMLGPMPGLKRQGGQRRQWLDDLCDWANMSLPQLVRAAEDRFSCRKLVHTASYTRLTNTPKILWHFVRILFCFLSFGKLRLSSVFLTSVCEAGNEAGCRISRDMWQLRPNFSLWTRFHKMLEPYRGTFVVFNAVSRLSISCFIPKILAVKSPKHNAVLTEDG